MSIGSIGSAKNEAVPTSAGQALEAFRNPYPEYSSGPLWVWNDLLTDEQITSTLQDLVSQKIRQVFVHPRPGLMTPYMSDEWLRLWDVTMAEADRLGMLVWIYDENSYPSGFAGGLVPEAMPDSRQTGIVFREESSPSPPAPQTLGVYRVQNGNTEDVTELVRSGASLTTGTYITVATEPAGTSPWFGDRHYVDLLNPAVTRKFLEVTLEPYRKRFGDRFGKTILGSFTDEPNIRIREIAYTPRLFELFHKRWGYDLKPHLASLGFPVGEWKRVRHNYWQLMNELFIENWAIPYYEYCEKHGLEVTGHFWDHEWPNIAGVPDTMAMYSWQQRPAIDCLMNNYAEHTHGQFGNARMGRELASVANQIGRKRTLCEAYGAGGWDLRFEDMKRIADWLAVLGVNTFNEHLSYITIRGARKRDHPQSFSYHTPWWPDYHMFEDYLARLSAAMSQGEQVNSVLLLQPTTTAYIYQGQSTPEDGQKVMGDAFQDLHIALERAQIGYDMGSEYVLEKLGAAQGRSLKVGRRTYDVVILSSGTENLNGTTLGLLETYSAAGGRVICCGDVPSLVDGRPDERPARLAEKHGWLRLSSAEAVTRLRSEEGDGFAIAWENSNNGILFHQRRRLTDGELLFLVNTSIEQPARGRWRSASARSAEKWDLESGQTIPALFTPGESGISGSFELPPCGSLLLLLKNEPGASAASVVETTRTVPAAGEFEVRRTEPNVLTLDYVDLRIGEDVTTGLYFFKAAEKVFRSVGLSDNPWERAVQFKDEILRRQLPADSGFEVTYRFTVRDEVPEDLAIVVERPDLYQITCNGEPVTDDGSWWLDRSFGRIPLGQAARVGENRVTLKASPVTVFHELEPAYVIGSFGVEAGEKGFTIVGEQPLKPGSWREQSHPFYAAAVAYSQSFNVSDPEGRYRIRLGAWKGSVARVKVNGKEMGHIAWAPWECDVTDAIRPGENRVEVTVIGTLKNTLGPHHGGPVRGSAWPANFYAGRETGPPPGKAYDLIDYGLFEPFQLVQAESR